MPLMRFRNNYATFEAREAEWITGVGRQIQREWRRRGFFAWEGEGRADHKLHDLARLIVMGVLADRGIGPSMSMDIATSAALRIEYFALNVPSSIEDSTGDEFERALARSGRPRVAAFVGWTNKAIRPERFLVAEAGGITSLTNDLNTVFTAPNFDGAVVVLDLEVLGTTIATRAGRPLVTVELVKSAADRKREKASAPNDVDA